MEKKKLRNELARIKNDENIRCWYSIFDGWNISIQAYNKPKEERAAYVLHLFRYINKNKDKIAEDLGCECFSIDIDGYSIDGYIAIKSNKINDNSEVHLLYG